MLGLVALAASLLSHVCVPRSRVIEDHAGALARKLGAGSIHVCARTQHALIAFNAVQRHVLWVLAAATRREALVRARGQCKCLRGGEDGKISGKYAAVYTE